MAMPNAVVKFKFRILGFSKNRLNEFKE